jgi:hypothetical protein
MYNPSLSEELKGKTWHDLIEALDVAYYLLEGKDEVIRHIPDCPVHGPMCNPHAIEWIEAHKSVIGDEIGEPSPSREFIRMSTGECWRGIWKTGDDSREYNFEADGGFKLYINRDFLVFAEKLED